MLESELELELPTIPTLRFAPAQKQLIFIGSRCVAGSGISSIFRRAQDFGLDRGEAFLDNLLPIVGVEFDGSAALTARRKLCERERCCGR